MLLFRTGRSGCRLLSPLLVLGCALQTGFAEDWPTFRGADRTGISSETGLLDTWPEGGPQLVLTAKGAGRGYASPAVVGDKMFTLGDSPSTASDKDEYLSCFSTTSGDLLWQTKTGPAWNSGKASWQGSRGTPSIDNDMVYVITPYGKLLAAKLSSGDVVWQRDLKEDFSGKKKDSWGYSESPLIDGNKLICTPGGPDTTVVALDKITGETLWQCARPEDAGAGHASVVISMVGDKKVYVQNTGCGPMGIDAESGELLWDYYVKPPTAFIPTAIVEGPYVFSVAGYGSGGALLKQVVQADGSIGVEEIYGLKVNLANKHGGVVKIDGKLYFGKEDRSALQCADMMTGEILWQERGEGRDSMAVTAADGKLIFRAQDGVVSLVAARADEYELLGTFKSPDSGEGDKPSWAHPVVSGKRLYLRESDNILVYDIAK